MRKRFQHYNYLYEVRSRIKFDKRGIQNQVTLYGSDKPLNKKKLLQRAEINIKKKFKKSSGVLIAVAITNVFF